MKATGKDTGNSTGTSVDLSQHLEQRLNIQEDPESSTDGLELLDLVDEGMLDEFDITEFGDKCICKAITVVDVARQAGDHELAESMTSALDSYEGTPDFEHVKAVLAKFSDGHEARGFVTKRLAIYIPAKGMSNAAQNIADLAKVDDAFGTGVGVAVQEILTEKQNG